MLLSNQFKSSTIIVFVFSPSENNNWCLFSVHSHTDEFLICMWVTVFTFFAEAPIQHSLLGSHMTFGKRWSCTLTLLFRVLNLMQQPQLACLIKTLFKKNIDSWSVFTKKKKHCRFTCY